MASSKLMPSTASTSSQKSDHRRNPINRPESAPKSELCLFQSHDSVVTDVENDLGSGSMISLDGFLRKATAERAGENNSGGGVVERESCFLNSEITLLDAAGAITPITDAHVESEMPPPLRRRTAEDVWSEIVSGGQSEEEGKVQCKEEAMDEVMTLEDFLVKAGAVDEAELIGDMNGQLKVEPGLSGEMFSFESPYMSRQGSLESVGMMGYSDGTVGIVGRKKRGANIFEPLDKATQQRQKRMIKNRESAARSRERKQAYQNELESMAVRLEEENEQLLKEKVERTKARRKMLMENVIPVEEKKRPPRPLRRVRSMLW